jgi:hypothetical protein
VKKVKKDRGPRKKAILEIYLYYINREMMGWDMQKNRETPFPPLPFSSSSIVDVWRVGLSLGGLLPRDGLLLVYYVSIFHERVKNGHTHGGDDGDHSVLSIVESVLNLLTEVGVGDLDIVLGVSITVHQVEETLSVSYSRVLFNSD